MGRETLPEPVHVFIACEGTNQFREGVYHYRTVESDSFFDQERVWVDPRGDRWHWTYTPCAYSDAYMVIRDQWPKAPGVRVETQSGTMKRPVANHRRPTLVGEIIRRVDKWLRT